MDINIKTDFEVFENEKKEKERKIDRNFKSTFWIILALVFYIILYSFLGLNSSDKVGIFIMVGIMVVLLGLAIYDLNQKTKDGIDLKISVKLPVFLGILLVNYLNYEKRSENIKITNIWQGIRHYSILFFGKLLDLFVKFGVQVVDYFSQKTKI